MAVYSQPVHVEQIPSTMNKVILFGSTGNLGKKIAEALTQAGYDLTAVVRNEEKRKDLAGITGKCLIADVTDPDSLKDCCHGFTIVISALGKSVSPNDKSKPSFEDIDLKANSCILAEALNSNIKKFVYVSAFGAEHYTHLTYFNVHYRFEEKLKASGIDYSIIKPPALFSSFIDLMEMAKKRQLINMGKGEKRTNPIYEGDLAQICVTAIAQPRTTIAAGGKEILSRREINQIIQDLVNPGKKVRTIPIGLVKALLPVIKLVDRNTYDKFAFFVEVMQHDTIAPPVGQMKISEYIKRKMQKYEPVMAR